MLDATVDVELTVEGMVSAGVTAEGTVSAKVSV